VLYAESRWLRESVPAKPEAGVSRVEGLNPGYAFRLARKPGQSAWSLTALATDDPPGLFSKSRGPRFAELTDPQVKMHGTIQFLEVEGIPLETLAADPSFRVTGSVDEGDRHRVEFECDVVSFSGPDRLQRGTLWLLPAASWAIDEYKVVIRPPGSGDAAVEMKMAWAARSARPVPKQFTLDYLSAKPPLRLAEEFSNWEYTTPPESAFSVATYGFPEPAGAAPPSASRGGWVAAAVVLGVVMVAVGLVLRSRAGKADRGITP
jgi:hypothetical protein